MKQLRQLKQRYNPTYHKNIRELLQAAAGSYGEETAFIIKHKIRGEEPSYERISFRRVLQQVNDLGTALLHRGWLQGRVAVIGKNSYPWLLAYFGVLCGDGVCVPLDKGLPYEELESSLIRSESKVLFFDPAMKDKVEQLKDGGVCPVETYISLYPLEGYTDLSSLMEEGRRMVESGDDSYLHLPIDGSEMRILLFTSGTTSMAKAVMLNHQNITSNVYAIQQSENILRGDVNMAFLPYHHTFGSMGQMVMIACGVTTAFCDGLKYVQKNIVEYKVSVFFCVPLLIESIYKKIMAVVKKEGLEAKVAFGLRLTKFFLRFGIDLRRRVFRRIHEQLGGNLRLVISGAASINPEVMEGFTDLGFSAIQGYGMTESSPVISAESIWERKTGSCGRALPGVEVTIDQPNEKGVGEVIVRGPNVMMGYYENEEETAKTLKDGWLHTGDLGYIDEEGYLFLCGRMKNVIVLKNGKNVYPEELETLLSNLPYTDEVFVFGQPRTVDDESDLVIGTKIVYKADYMKTEYGWDLAAAKGEEEGAKIRAAIDALVRADIDRINEMLPIYKHILRITVTDQPMIKTTTGKIKRFEEIKQIQLEQERAKATNRDHM